MKNIGTRYSLLGIVSEALAQRQKIYWCIHCVAGEGPGGRSQEGVHQLGRGLLQEEPGLQGQHQQDPREDAAHQGAGGGRTQRAQRSRRLVAAEVRGP